MFTLGCAVEQCHTSGALILLYGYPALPGWAMFGGRPSGPWRVAILAAAGDSAARDDKRVGSFLNGV
jgi:hypothetical protein